MPFVGWCDTWTQRCLSLKKSTGVQLCAGTLPSSTVRVCTTALQTAGIHAATGQRGHEKQSFDLWHSDLRKVGECHTMPTLHLLTSTLFVMQQVFKSFKDRKTQNQAWSNYLAMLAGLLVGADATRARNVQVCCAKGFKSYLAAVSRFGKKSEMSEILTFPTNSAQWRQRARCHEPGWGGGG